MDGCELRPIAYSHFRFEVEGDMSHSPQLRAQLMQEVLKTDSAYAARSRGLPRCARAAGEGGWGRRRAGSAAVLYCWELQVDQAAARRRGLGRFLMTLLELLARRSRPPPPPPPPRGMCSHLCRHSVPALATAGMCKHCVICYPIDIYTALTNGSTRTQQPLWVRLEHCLGTTQPALTWSARCVLGRHGMEAVMLTVMNDNADALALYGRLGYVMDASSPSACDAADTSGYEILCKSLAPRVPRGTPINAVFTHPRHQHRLACAPFAHECRWIWQRNPYESYCHRRQLSPRGVVCRLLRALHRYRGAHDRPIC